MVLRNLLLDGGAVPRRGFPPQLAQTGFALVAECFSSTASGAYGLIPERPSAAMIMSSRQAVPRRRDGHQIAQDVLAAEAVPALCMYGILPHEHHLRPHSRMAQ